MARAYLGIGTNLGDRLLNVRGALAELARLPGTQLTAISRLYGSAPWGKPDQPDFLNMVAEVQTALEPLQLLHECKRIERMQGRVAGERWGPRVLDIDILLYDRLVVNTPELVVPHPRMWERRFVLQPLADLAPQLAGPGGKTIEVLLNDKEISSQQVWLWGELKELDENETA